MVIESAPFGHGFCARTGRRMSPAAQQVDFDQIDLAAKNLALLLDVLLASRISNCLVGRAEDLERSDEPDLFSLSFPDLDIGLLERTMLDGLDMPDPQGRPSVIGSGQTRLERLLDESDQVVVEIREPIRVFEIGVHTGEERGRRSGPGPHTPHGNDGVIVGWAQPTSLTPFAVGFTHPNKWLTSARVRYNLRCYDCPGTSRNRQS